MHVQWKTTWVKAAWRPRRSTNGGTILVGSTNSVLPPHVPASHLMIPRRIHSLLDVPSKPLSLASTARDSPGVHLDERRLRSSVMMVRRTMSACGDFFNKAELGSGVNTGAATGPVLKPQAQAQPSTVTATQAAFACRLSVPMLAINGSRCADEYTRTSS